MNKIFVLILISFITMNANALVIWDETVDGGLNDDWGDPTLLIAQAGSNIISGTVGPTGSDWLDTFTFDIASNLSLSNIVLNSYSGDGTVFVLEPITETCNCAGYDVYSRIGSSNVGQDMGPLFLSEFNNDLSQYFALVEANYSTYSIDFVFESATVPEPGPLSLIFFGLMSLTLKEKLTNQARRTR